MGAENSLKISEILNQDLKINGFLREPFRFRPRIVFKREQSAIRSRKNSSRFCFIKRANDIARGIFRKSLIKRACRVVTADAPVSSNPDGFFAVNKDDENSV